MKFRIWGSRSPDHRGISLKSRYQVILTITKPRRDL